MMFFQQRSTTSSKLIGTFVVVWCLCFFEHRGGGVDSFMLNNGSKEHRGGGVGLSVTAEQLKMGKPSGQINRDDEGIVNDNDFDDNTHGLFSMTTTRTRNSVVVGNNRRQMMTQGISSLVAVSAAICHPQSSSAAVGTLPELADTNAFLQGITINVADGDQQKMMINFLVKSFDMEILRQTVQDSVEETVRAKMQRSRSSLV